MEQVPYGGTGKQMMEFEELLYKPHGQSTPLIKGVKEGKTVRITPQKLALGNQNIPTLLIDKMTL